MHGWQMSQHVDETDEFKIFGFQVIAPQGLSNRHIFSWKARTEIFNFSY